MAPELAALLKDVLGPDYRVERELEGGGMSRVFLATDIRHDRAVVVKVLPPELVSAQSAQRFKREIEITARLQHPHILPVLTSGTWDDGAYFITPFISGESLRTRIAREKRLPLDDIVKILGDVCSAVAYAHARGIIHRDIKPGNILFAEGESILADFGIARIVSTEATPITTTGVILGTPMYMAPEMATHEAADVYSLGVVACEMLTGALPTRAMSAREIVTARGTVPGDSGWRLAALAALISRAVAPSLTTRTVSVKEMLAQLDAARHRWTRRHAGIAVGAMAAAGLAVFALSAARKNHADLADAKYMVASVGAADSVTSDAVRSVSERLGDWSDVIVADQALDPSTATKLGSGSVKDALARSRRLGARNVVLVDTRADGDSLSIGATLYDAGADSAVRARRVIVGSKSPRAGRVMPYRLIVNSLLRDNDLLPWRSGEDRTQASLAAWRAHDAGQRWLRSWRLDSAEAAFRNSIALDNGIGSSHLWLAQTLEWRDTARRGDRHAEAHLALTARAPVSGRDSAYAIALQSLADGDYALACAQYRSILARDSLNFVAQLDLGDCLSRDRLIVRNAHTLTGWAFRSGYEGAGRYYRSAAENSNARDESRFRGWLLGRLSSVYGTATNRIRTGIALTPDTVVMGARVYLAGDTVAYAPHPLADFATLRGDPPASASEAAVDRNRELLLSFAQDWARRSPTDPSAYDSLAMWSELTGGSAQVGGHRLYTLDLLAYARSISRDSTEQLRLALAEVRNLVKSDQMERAYAKADSLLRAGVADRQGDFPGVAGIAALVGRVDDTARLLAVSSRGVLLPNGRMWIPPSTITAAATRLLALASMGASRDTVETLVRRTCELITSINRDSVQARGAMTTLIVVPVTFSTRLPRIPRSCVAPPNDEIARAAYLADSGRVDQSRNVLLGLRQIARGRGPGNGVSSSFRIAIVALTVGDTIEATRVLDDIERTMPVLSPTLLDDVTNITSLIRSLALRAQLAAASGDVVYARKLAAEVIAVWSHGDASVQPLVASMRVVGKR